jgi:hypothetical protein
MLIWSFLIAGSPAPGTGRLSVLIAGIATLMGLWIGLLRHGPMSRLAAALILVTTPAYVSQVLGSGIDTHRLSLLLFAVITLVFAASHRDWRSWLAAGLVCGLALNSHSLTGVLVPFVIFLTLALARIGPFLKLIGATALVATAAFVIGGERYVLNSVEFGIPVINYVPLWDLVPSLDYHGWRESLAPRHDLWGRLSSGSLMGFTDWHFFGLSWWICVAAAVGMRKEIFADRMTAAFAGAIFCSTLVLVVFLGLLPNGELLIANYRYPMTVQPFVAALGGVFIGRLLES